MGLLVRAACLLLAGWVRGAVCVGVGGVGRCAAAASLPGSLQGAEAGELRRQAGRTFLKHSLGPRERPLLDYCSDSYDTSMCYLGNMRSWHKTAASHAEGNDLEIAER